MLARVEAHRLASRRSQNHTGHDGPRADVWSLGCLALECGVGQGAFESLWLPKYTRFFEAATPSSFGGDEARRFKDALALTVAAAAGGGGDDTGDALHARLAAAEAVAAAVVGCLALDPAARPSAALARDSLAAAYGV